MQLTQSMRPELRQLLTPRMIQSMEILQLPLQKLEERIDAVERSASGLANLFPPVSDNLQIGVAEAMLFANNEALQKSLLEGTGTFMRHVKLRPGRDVDAEALGRLIETAYAEMKALLTAE